MLEDPQSLVATSIGTTDSGSAVGAGASESLTAGACTEAAGVCLLLDLECVIFLGLDGSPHSKPGSISGRIHSISEYAFWILSSISCAVKPVSWPIRRQVRAMNFRSTRCSPRSR